MADEVDDPTTAWLWEDFQEYPLQSRGPTTVPARFLQSAWWREDLGEARYVVYSMLIANGNPNPVELNTEHLCWVELCYICRDAHWLAFRIAEPDLDLAIHSSELTPAK